MHSPLRRAAAAGLAAVAGAGLFVTGCKPESQKADLSIREVLSAQTEKLDSADRAAATLTPIQQTAQQSEASDIVKAQAKSTLGQAEAATADALSAKLQALELRIASLTTSIDSLRGQIQANNLSIAGALAMEPKKSQAAIQKQMASAAEDKAGWYPADQGAIPSAAGAKDQADKLQAQITATQDQIKSLQDQRVDLMKQAEQSALQADSSTGPQSSRLFIQAADLRKKAGDLAAQIDALTSSLLAPQQQLAVAQAQAKQAGAAAAMLKQQSDQLATNWEDIQKQVKVTQDLSRTLLDGSGVPAAAAGADATPASTQPAAPTIASLSADLAKAVLEAKGLREQTVKHLQNALKAYQESATSRDAVLRTYQARLNNPSNKDASEVPAWKGLIEASNPSEPKLKQANIQLRLARVATDEASSAAARLAMASALKSTLEQASLSVPAALADVVAPDDVKSARQRALDAYDLADKDLQTVVGTPKSTETVKNTIDAAQVAQIVELYSRAQLALSMGDESSGKKLLNDAKAMTTDALSNGLPLPTPLPPELAPAPAAPPPSIIPTTTGPATAPATPTTGPSTNPFDTPAAPAAQ